MKALVLDGWSGYPPFQKRIRSMARYVESFDVLAIERDYNLGRQASWPSTTIGRFHRGKYWTRFRSIASTIQATRSLLKQNNIDVVYCLGFEMGFAAACATRGLQEKPILVYEIHDIRDLVLSDSIAGRLARQMDKWTVRCMNFLIVTSDHYLRKYYLDLGCDHLNTQVIENKILPDLADVIARHKVPPERRNRPLVIGYFGALRCRRSWDLLRQIAAAGEGRIHISMRGDTSGIPGLEAEVKDTDFITFGGPFSDPDDIVEVYSSADMIWLAGYQNKISYAWSRTCRYYYACSFGKPMIASADTADGQEIEYRGLGMVIDIEAQEEAIAKVLSIDDDQLVSWQTNLNLLDPSHYILNHDDAELFRHIEGCFHSHQA